MNKIVTIVLNVACLSIVNTLCLGKPEKGKMVEEMLVNMAQRGQIAGKLGEKELISLLESVNQQTQRKTTVKVSAMLFLCVCYLASAGYKFNNNIKILHFSLIEEEQPWILMMMIWSYSNLCVLFLRLLDNQ